MDGIIRVFPLGIIVTPGYQVQPQLDSAHVIGGRYVIAVDFSCPTK